VTYDVHVVALGARTPLGLTAESSVAAVRAGISRVAEHPTLVDRTAEPVRAARDGRLDPTLTGPERVTELAAAALEEVGRKLASRCPDDAPIPVLLALPETRPGWSATSSVVVRDALHRRPMPVAFRPLDVAPLGHAAALTALDSACERIRAGRAALCVIAGADSYLDPETVSWLDGTRQLATAYHRGAFFPGEAAGAVALASGPAVDRYGFDSLGVVVGTGTAMETRLSKTDAVCVGEGLTACVRRAVSPLLARGAVVDGIVCDINGERYRSEEWGFTLLRLPEAFVDPTAYDMPAACWGDVGAASGPLFVAVAALAGRRGWAKGPRYLVWAGSEAGARAAAVLELGAPTDGARP
jgi:3-oxoacyl-[acyl-carrier-protein] synthase-1